MEAVRAAVGEEQLRVLLREVDHQRLRGLANRSIGCKDDDCTVAPVPDLDTAP
jgi:hypothetical protein